MLRERRMIVEAMASPPESRSPLHFNSYSLPSNSRLPKFMIAAVAGFIVLTTGLYYICKWWCFRKRGGGAGGLIRASDSGGSSPDSTAPAVVISEDDLQARASKALAQRVGSKIAMAIPSIDFSRLREIRSEKIGATDGAGIDGEACAICLTEFSPGARSEFKILPKCGHAFHSVCIDIWLCTHASCPVCRASLLVVMFSRSAPPRHCCSPPIDDCPSPSQDCPSPSTSHHEEDGDNLPVGHECV